MKETSLLLICLILCNCSDEIRTKGKVYDENTRKEIAHRKIIIQGLEENNDRYKPLFTSVIYADSTGTFKYNIEKQRNIWLYDLSFVGDSSYCYASYRLGLSDFRKHGQFLEFYLNPLTDLTINLLRKNKTTYTDTLYVSWECDGIDGRKLYPYRIENYAVNDGGNSRLVEFRWIGGDVKSAIKTRVIADKTTIVHWQLFRGGEDRRFADTIICRKGMMNYSTFVY